MNRKGNIKECSDTELLSYYKESDDGAVIGELYTRYTHLVFGVCMKYLKNEVDAEDAVMQIFEKLMKDLRKHNIDNFKGWLYMVAKNYCLMQLRGDQSQLKKDKELKKDLPAVVETAHYLHLDGENEKERSLLRLEDAIRELNEEQRICIELFYLKQMCYKEVSDLSGFTMNQVKSYIQNGKRNLKIIMERNEQPR